MSGHASGPGPHAKGVRKAVMIALGLIILAGVLIRIRLFGQALYGDEMSTLWIVGGRSASEVLDLVRSDAEISPPLFFLLAWVTEKVWTVPEAVRLPSLLAGLGLLPVIWLLARDLFDRRAAAAATSIAAVAPILVYLSTNGRGYSVMLFFLALSTLGLLRGARGRGSAWWALYALGAAGAMYSHYIGVFYLLGQFAWLLWAHPERRRPALLASLGAALLYLPWLGGFRADSDSPTTPLLEALQGHGFEAKRVAVEQLLFWDVQGKTWSLDGRFDVWLLVAGVIVCAIGCVLAARNGSIGRRPGPSLVLVLVLVLATPVGSLLVGLVSTDTFGGRNLAATWIGLTLLAGFGVARAGWRFGLVSLALLLAGLTIGSVRLTDADRSQMPYSDVAAFIQAHAGPGDALVDNSHVTPVPLTPLDAYLDSRGLAEFHLNLQSGEPPFLPGGHVPDSATQVRDAFSGRGDTFVVTLAGEQLVRDGQLFVGTGYVPIPEGWRVARQESFDGLFPITVTVFERSPGPDDE